MKHIKILVTFILMMSMMIYCGAGVYALDDGGEPEPGAVIPAEWDIDNIDDFTRMLNYLNTDGERPCVANLKVDINFPYPVQAIGNDLTIKGNGHTISGVTHYIARDGRTITFGNTSGNKLTLKGSDRTSIGNDNMGLLASDKKGHFVMYSGVTVQDNFTSRGFGGAVTLIGGSSFHMYGGTIQNCGVVDSPAGVSNGGAIAILDESTFIMDGGIIENCSAEATATLSGGGGGAVFIGDSTFIMNGGTIRNCKASGAGGAILVAGSKDEYSTSSTIGSHLEINGGTITGNTARAGAGICAKSYNYESSEESMGRVPSENAGSGSGFLEIKNCTITDNKATGIGGGILLQDIKLADGKNIVVSGCTITGNGGYGLKFDDTTRVCLKGVSTIFDNKAGDTQANVVGATTENPLIIGSDISGSKIGITDSKIAAGGNTPEARLTTGYGSNNSQNPSKPFVSDHEGWIAGFAEGAYKDEVWLYKSANLTYTLHFNNGEEDQTKNYDVSNPVSLPVLTSDDPDKVFDGWYDNEECKGTAVTKTPDAAVGHVDYYAKWNIHVHANLSEQSGHPATCTEDGQKTYYVCSCGKWFEDSTATKLIANHDDVIIPAKGHTEVTDPAVEASCTKDGLTEGKHCSVCEEVLVAQEKVPALGHIDEDNNLYCDRCGTHLGSDPDPAPGPSTGDDNSLILWMILGLTSMIALAGSAATALVRRK